MSARRVAVDLGASSGRVAVGQVVDGRLEFEVVHRFPNSARETEEGLKWDFQALYAEVLKGLEMAGEFASLGVDSWAVDYGIVRPDGSLVSEPYCYRDARTSEIFASLTKAEKAEIFDQTGLQFLPFNTLYQLKAHRAARPQDFEEGNQVLLLPDLIHFLLTGKRTMERTNASTTQMLNPSTSDWSDKMLHKVPVQRGFLPSLIEAGTTVGTTKDGVEVIAPATHDTGSAVLAVPMDNSETCAYVSSGTWSLVGLELTQPVLTQEAAAANFSNEGGAFGTVRFLKNVMGLWILQECMRAWQITDVEALLTSAKSYLEDAPLFDPDDEKFLAPGIDMPSRVSESITDPAQLAASILVSLADKTAKVVQQAGTLARKSIGTIHIVGGGSQNALLNQLIANRAGLKVVAGPVEATLMGNLLVQAQSAGELGSLSIRDVVKNSVQLHVFEPQT